MMHKQASLGSLLFLKGGKPNEILPKLLIFLVLTIVVIIVICSLSDIQEIAKVLKNINVPWLCFGFLFLFLYMIFYPLPLYFLGKSKTEKSISYIDSAICRGPQELY